MPGADADLVAAVGWTQTNVLFSVADDKCIQSWSIDGEPLAKVCDIDCFATDFHWLVAPGAADSEVLALASGDGMRFVPHVLQRPPRLIHYKYLTDSMLI